MAANTQGWAVVQKQAKKPRAAIQTKTKGSKISGKEFIEQMPRIESAPPVKESSTIYDAFIDKKPESERNGSIKGKGGSKTTKTQQPAKKKSTHDKNKVKAVLSDVCKTLDVQEFDTLLSTVKERFPGNPSVWLKDLSSLLNLKLDQVAVKGSVYSDKDVGHPSSLLTNKVRNLLLKTIRQSSVSTLELFVGHCLQSLSSDSSKDVSVHGDRIMMQLVLITKPEVVTGKIDKYADMVKSSQNRPQVAQDMLQALGQAGNSDISNALRVWLDLMLPMIHVKQLSAFVIQYLENILRLHRDALGSARLTFREFFPLLDLIYGPHPTLPTNLQKRLQNLYPQLKSLAFSSENLHQFFPSFLVRCAPNNPRELREECLRCLVECLTRDSVSYSKWRQMYTKNLVQSGVLLGHLAEQWTSLSRAMDTNMLRSTVTAFSVDNQSLPDNTPGVGACTSACQVLLSKNQGFSFPWLWIPFVLLVLLAAGITTDVYTNNGFDKSQTRHYLEKFNVLQFMEQVWARVQLYYTKVLQWLVEHVPLYYSRACALLNPYLQLFWGKLYEAAMYLMTLSEPLIKWIHINAPIALNWVQKQLPWLLDGVTHIFDVIITTVVAYSLWIWQNVISVLQVIGEWLLQNVFVGSWSLTNLSATASMLVTQTREHIFQAWQWCSDLVNGEHAGSQTVAS